MIASNTIENIGATAIGVGIGIGKSVTTLEYSWIDALPSGPEMLHTVILALIGGFCAIIGKILFRLVFPRKKKDGKEKT